MNPDTDSGAPQPTNRARGGLLFALLGVTIAVVALEIVFRLLPVSSSSASGYYIDANILTYPAGQRFTTATGWNLKNPQHHKANNYGFVGDHDFSRNPKALALIGDSFVEASMLAPDERLAAQLESQLPGRIVFAMGGPGSSLLDYAERLRFASQEFGTRDFVLLLEYGDVGQALCGSGNVHAACLDRETLAPRIVKQPA